MNPNHKKSITIIVTIVIVVLLGLAGAAYWYLLMGPKTAPTTGNTPGTTTGTGGFKPLDRNGKPIGSGTSTGQTNGTGGISQASSTKPLPTLRLLSATPVGGYGATTTPKTTLVRWVDRGRGNINEASYNSPIINSLSNTIVPRVYNSLWNKSLTAFVASMLGADGASWTTVYTQLIAQATSTATSSPDADLSPFALRGKRLPDGIIDYALSPKKDRMFSLVLVDGNSVGFITALDGTSPNKLFTSPLTQIRADWPSDNAITILTKGSRSYPGYLYIADPKTGAWTKILGPVLGLSAVMSHDGKYILWSSIDGNGELTTSIYSIAKKSSADAGIRTLADKCAWGNFYPDIVYCGVPNLPPTGNYPDDWYRGSASTVDGVWQVDALDGLAHQISSIVDQGKGSINTFNLGLDQRDNYLFFMNKDDLSLWSLDLVAAH